MQIIEWDEFLKHGLPQNNAQTPAASVATDVETSVAMTVGVFDGVHKGHKALINRVVSSCGQGTVPAAVTFREPAYKSENIAFIIQSFEEKAAALEGLGIKILIVIDFTEDFSRMTGMQFLETLMSHAQIVYFAVGANFRCGCGLDTDAAAVKNFFNGRGIAAEIVPEVLHDGLPVSSSRIRAALSEGDLELAQSLIG